MARPEGVKVVRVDGTELDCELVNVGLDEKGMDVWEVTGVTFNEGDRLKVAVLPAKTTISVAAVGPMFLRRGEAEQ